MRLRLPDQTNCSIPTPVRESVLTECPSALVVKLFSAPNKDLVDTAVVRFFSELHYEYVYHLFHGLRASIFLPSPFLKVVISASETSQSNKAFLPSLAPPSLSDLPANTQ